MADSQQPTDTSGSALTRLWRHRDFRRLLVGQAISGVGDWMATVALMALVLDISGSSTAVGAVLVLRLAPTIVAGPLATRIIHRWDRRRMMLAMDAFRVGVAVAIPLVAHLWWVYLWAFLMEVGGLVFLPARDAVVPDLAGDDDLPLANGLVLGSSYGTIPLGAGAFGLAAALFDRATTYVFWVDALTFAVSFVAIWRIGSLRPRGAERHGSSDDAEGFLDAFRLPVVRAVAPTALVVAVGLGALFSLGIVFVRDVLGATNTQFGVLVALFGVGAAIGLGVLQLVGQPGLRGVLAVLGAQGAVVAGMSLSPNVGVAFVGAVLFGATTAAALAGAMSILQSRLDDDRRVVAFTAFHVIIRGGLAASAIAAGAVNDALGSVRWPVLGQLPPARLVLFCSGAVVLATSLASQGTAHRIDRPSGEADRAATDRPPGAARPPAATAVRRARRAGAGSDPGRDPSGPDAADTAGAGQRRPQPGDVDAAGPDPAQRADPARPGTAGS